MFFFLNMHTLQNILVPPQRKLLEGDAVGAHVFAVPRELDRELFLPHAGDILVHDHNSIMTTQPHLRELKGFIFLARSPLPLSQMSACTVKINKTFLCSFRDIRNSNTAALPFSFT